MLSIDVCDTNDEQYAAYIDAVLEKGFTVDYSRSGGWFRGETKDGYSVRISHDESNKDIMSISLRGPDDSSTSDISTALIHLRVIQVIFHRFRLARASDLAYYNEVMARCTQKLASISQ